MQEREQYANDAPAPVRWGMRIFVTLFTVPFFVVGFAMLFGGIKVGGLGWFGAAFGLPFIAVPSIMLIGVWFGTDRKTPPQPAEPERQPTASIQPVQMVNCRYCGRARHATDTRCPSCGA